MLNSRPRRPSLYFRPLSAATNRLKSTENLSRPGSQQNTSPTVSSQHQAPAPPPGGDAHDDAQKDSQSDMQRHETNAVPEHSVYIQIIDFLLEVKAMSVSTG